jgi:CheY-like chemotaxis protein
LELKSAALLLKPVKQAEVLGALLLACGQSEYSEPRRPADVKKDQPPSLAQSPLRVLLVEDGVANQKLAVGLLQRWGHTVTIANNGAIAVEFCQQQPFDLVLMDLQMPVMDGLEATRQIRQREAGTGQHLPIVAMTAHALVGDRDRCLRAGMDHYISKPIHKKDLAEVIMMFSRHDGGEGAEPVADKTPTAQTPAPPAAAPPTEIAAIDLQAALEMMENDHDILQSVVEAFVIEAPVLLEQLDQAIASGDLVTAQRSAHTLKGNFRLLQLHDHQRLWEQVEMLAKERKVELLSAPIEQARAMTRQSLLQLGRCLEEGI